MSGPRWSDGEEVPGLAAGEIQFRSIIDNHVDGIVVVDAAGKILYRNEAARGLLSNLEDDSYFGFPVTTGDIRELDLRPDGEHVIVEMRVHEIAWGDQTAYLAILRDITERKVAEDDLIAERQKLDRVIMGSADAIVFVSADGQVLEWNPAAERMFG